MSKRSSLRPHCVSHVLTRAVLVKDQKATGVSKSEGKAMETGLKSDVYVNLIQLTTLEDS